MKKQHIFLFTSLVIVCISFKSLNYLYGYKSVLKDFQSITNSNINNEDYTHIIPKLTNLLSRSKRYSSYIKDSTGKKQYLEPIIIEKLFLRYIYAQDTTSIYYYIDEGIKTSKKYNDSTFIYNFYRHKAEFEKFDNPQLALQDHLKAKEYRPENYHRLFYTKLIPLYIKVGEYDQAFELIKRYKNDSKRIVPISYFRHLQTIYLEKGEIDKALEIFQESINYGKKNFKHYSSIRLDMSHDLGEYLYRHNKKKQAIKYLQDSKGYKFTSTLNKKSFNAYAKLLSLNKQIHSYMLLDSIYNESHNYKLILKNLRSLDSLRQIKYQYNANIHFLNVKNTYENSIVKFNHDISKQKKKVGNIIFISIIIILLLIIAIFYNKIISNRKFIEKNKIIFEKHKHSLEEFNSTTTTDNNIPLEDEKLKEIYTNIIKEFKDNKIYLDPTLNRKSISDIVFTNENYVRNAINKYSEYKTISKFINYWRINYACSMLRNETGINISDIAYQSGFENRQSFYNAFNSVVGMTPKEYIYQIEIEKSKTPKL